MLVLRLDPGTAAHLAVAIRLYERRLGDDGMPLPDGLRTLMTEAAAASKRQEPTSLASPEDAPEGGPTHLLTVREAAERMRLSTRQLERYIASGQLTSTRWGRSRRIRPADLEAFIERGSASA